MQQIISKLREEIQSSTNYFIEDIGTIRTGRAHPSMVEDIKVDAYQTQMEIKSLATITTPDARSIIVQPWDHTILPAIEKAIRASDLSINPIVDNDMIRINLPDLTLEQRQEMIKLLHRKSEDARVKVRLARRDAMTALHEMKDQGALSEDELTRAEETVQKVHDEGNERIDALKKEKEAKLTVI